ncbi:M28 family peptidase [Pedobacter sp. SYSU D00535]|uniref:M28 family peptidase n=1 Tax=Pedobacter sp. SYSU D00535 TaxID=2810308 RepID=UPI001A95EA9C|nr:M28 family peptidase [Pedobacter sp. SYSU D00535]
MNSINQNADSARLYKHVEFLTSINPPRNSENIASLNQAANYIERELREYGLSTGEQKWKVGGEEFRNVIASYNPEKPGRLIVGAHYDVCGDQPGADDNASAVAGLLETARLVAMKKPDLDYRIDFVAYNLEEPPHFSTSEMGSYVHAKSLKDQQVPVIGMICYEMIGYFSDKPRSQGFPSDELAAKYPNTGNFIIVVGLEQQKEFSERVYSLMKATNALDVQKINFPSPVGLAGLSDHKNYWLFGFPAVMINDTSFLRNPNYHKTSDTIGTLNFTKIAAVVDASLNAILNF